MSRSAGSVFEKDTTFTRQRASGGVLHIQLVGPTVGTREAPIISEDAIATIDSMKGQLSAVVLDLTEISFMSSIGLGTCINIRNRAEAIKATPVLFGLNPDLKKLFAMMRLDRLYKVADSPEALRKLLG